MRHIACMNEECANHGAPFFDFEPPEVILPCAGCGSAMVVTTLAALDEVQVAIVARAEHAEAIAAAEAEAVAAKTAPAPDPVAERLRALGDKPVTASELLAILRPKPIPEELDANTADLGLQEEPG